MRHRLAVAVALSLICLQSGVVRADPGPGVGQVRVLTQNLYVGADIFRIFDAQTPAEIPFVVAGILQTVVETDFPERAAALAQEIERRRPHLIGLQEVSLIRVQSPGDFLIGNPQPAQLVLYDYLEILLAELEDLGMSYQVAAVVENADIELPYFAGIGPGGLLFDDVRLTDRDVILARSDVVTSNSSGRNFAINLAFNLGGIPFELRRGFVAVDVLVQNRSYRFVNTHLEVQSLVPVIQALQMLELIVELAGESDPILLVGDLNSDPDDPFPRPYAQLQAAGYVDTWLERVGAPEPGFTCCQSETLTNEASQLGQRIDHFFVQNDTALPEVGPVRSEVVGDEQADRTPSGLWQSDHGGVVAKIIIPAPGS